MRTTTSDPERQQPWWSGDVETVVMDALDADQVTSARRGVDAVYYLIHGMGGDDFVSADRAAAINVARAATTHAVGRII